MFWKQNKELMVPTAEQALSGRAEEMPVKREDKEKFLSPRPTGVSEVILGMGCFWGVERLFNNLAGTYAVASGYAGGYTPNPTYKEVCSGKTAHTEVVLVLFHEAEIEFQQIMKVFWENHDPTQGMRQGNDVGTQYRSAILCSSQEQFQEAVASRERYQELLDQSGFGKITTEIKQDRHFFFAEPEHQEYLMRNPNGYCGLRGTGVVYEA